MLAQRGLPAAINTEVVMSSTEKPSTRRSRMVIAALIWVFMIPFFIMPWFMLGWISLVGVAGAVWWTQDYIRRSGIDPDHVGRAGGWSGKPPGGF